MNEVSTPQVQQSNSDTGSVSDWFRSGDQVKTGFAFGRSFAMKPVRYSVIGSMAIFEGDIALGTVAQMDEIAAAVADSSTLKVNAVVITGDELLWPHATIPFEIHPDLPDPARVTDAMGHWSAVTPLNFVARDPNDPAHNNYVSFEQQDGCWSQVGMRGGKQVVSLSPTCTRGSAIHEIGHVAGLWHEQSRADRDEHIQILWENIQEGREHNFDQQITDGDDVGDYDFSSIMHYPALAFSRNGQPTIVTKGGQQIGQRDGASAGDIAAIRALYSRDETTGPTNPNATGASGTELLGSVPPFDSRRWTTQDWPIEWNVIWTIIPSPVGSRVEWNVFTERQSDTELKYYIGVRNLGPETVTVDVRYRALP